MSVGDPERGGHKWALNKEQSRPIIQKAANMNEVQKDCPEAISAFRDDAKTDLKRKNII